MKAKETINSGIHILRTASRQIFHPKPQCMTTIVKKSSQNSSLNFTKTFTKKRINEMRQIYNKSQSPQHLLHKRSISRHKKNQQKVNMQPLDQNAQIKNKLNDVLKVFKMSGNEKEFCLSQLLQDLKFRYRQYESMISNWQKNQLYDEIDKLIYYLNHFYKSYFKQFSQKAFQKMFQIMNNYESQLDQIAKALQYKHNQFESKINHQEFHIKQLELQLEQSYLKNIFCSRIFSQIQNSKFDLTSFIKSCQTYQQYVNSFFSFESSVSDGIKSQKKNEQLYDLKVQNSKQIKQDIAHDDRQISCKQS